MLYTVVSLIFFVDIEEIEIVYSSGKDSDNWIKEEPDYYPEKEIREYLEAHPYIVQNYLFETSLRTGWNVNFPCME